MIVSAAGCGSVRVGRRVWIGRSALALMLAFGLKTFAGTPAAQPSAPSSNPPAANQPSATDLLQQHGAVDAFEQMLRAAPDAQRGDLLDARALFYVETGDLDSAMSDLDDAIKLNPHDPKALAHRALAYLTKGDFDSARRDIEDALLHDPRSVDALLTRAWMEMAARDQTSALTDFGMIASIEGDTARGHWAKALILDVQHQPDAALAEVDASLSRDTGYVLSLIARGHLLRELKRYAEATAVFDRLIQIAPRLPDGYLGRCMTDVLTKDTQHALKSCNDAVTAAPGLMIVHVMNGLVLFIRHDYDSARAEADRAIQLSPNAKYGYFLRADVEDATLQFRGSLADASSAMQLDPQDPYAYVKRAEAYRQLGDFNLAIADCNQALTLQPGMYGALVLRGLSEDGTRAFDASIKDLEAAIALRPEEPVAYANLGKTYADEGDEDRARVILDKTVSMVPSDPAIRVTRASVDFYRHEFAKAIEDTTFATANREGSSLMDAVEGYSEFALGNFKAAEESFRRRFSKEPGSLYAVLWLYASERRAGIEVDWDVHGGLEGASEKPWPGPLAQYFGGKLDPDALARIVGAYSGHACEAQFWEGEKFMIDGNRVAAKSAFQASTQLCPRTSPAGAVATAELSRL